MAAALGMILGSGMSALGGYAAEKVQQKHEADTLRNQFLIQNMNKLGNNEELAKDYKAALGPHGAEMAKGIADAYDKMVASRPAFPGSQPSPSTQMMGSATPGATPPAQAGFTSPVGPQSQMPPEQQAAHIAQRIGDPNDPQTWMTFQQHLQQWMSQPSVAMDKDQMAWGKAQASIAQQNFRTLSEMQRSSPAAAGQRKQAELDVENAPRNARAEANRAAQKKTAEAKAALDVAGSSEAMDVAKRKHDITAGGKAGSAETERKKRVDVVTALGKQWDSEHKIAGMNPFGSNKDRDAYIRNGLGGVDPQAYIQGAGTSPSDDSADAIVNKHFPKK